MILSIQYKHITLIASVLLFNLHISTYCSAEIKDLTTTLNELDTTITTELENRLTNYPKIRDTKSIDKKKFTQRNLASIYAKSDFKKEFDKSNVDNALKNIFQKFYMQLMTLETALSIYDPNNPALRKSISQTLDTLLVVGDDFEKYYQNALNLNSEDAKLAEIGFKLIDTIFTKTDLLIHYDRLEAENNIKAFEKIDNLKTTTQALQKLKFEIFHVLSIRLDNLNQQLKNNTPWFIAPLNELYRTQLEEYANVTGNEELKKAVVTLVDTTQLVNSNAIATYKKLEKEFDDIKNKAITKNNREIESIAQIYGDLAKALRENTEQIIGLIGVETTFKWYVDRNKSEKGLSNFVKKSFFGGTIALMSSMLGAPFLAGGLLGEMVIASLFMGGFGFATVPSTGLFFLQGSPEWNLQLQKLYDNKVIFHAAHPFYIGCSLGNYNCRRKFYLVSAQFNDTAHAFENNHYEIYLMPTDRYIGDFFFALNLMLKEKTYRDSVAFLAIRPTPGVTKSPFNNKHLPRIIIGLKPNIEKDTVEKLIQAINSLPVQSLSGNALGLNVQPRYSKKFNNLIYTAYGSADYKDGQVFKSSSEFKAIINKSKRSWTEWWYGPSDEDMAYPEKSFALFQKD